MKHLLSFILLLLCSMSLPAQDSKTLNRQLSAASVQEKVKILQQLAELYLDPYHPSEKAADSAFYFAKQALKQSTAIKDSYAISRSNVLLARSYTQKGQTEKAGTYARTALTLATGNNFQDVRGEALEELYNELNFYNELEQKTGYLEQALEAYGKKSSKKQLANILTLASDHYNYIGDNAKALELGEQALKIYKTIPGASLTNIYRVMGNNYYTAGLNKKAIDYFLQAARHGEALNKEHELLSYTYNQLAIIYTQLSDNELCLKYLYKALDQAIIIKDKQAIYTAVNNISGVLVRMKRYRESESFLTNISRKYPPEMKIDQITLKLCFLTNYLSQKNYSMARRYCNELHKLADDAANDLPELFVFSLNTSFARFYLAVKEFDKARQYLDKIKVYAEKSEGFNRKKTFYTLAYQIDSTQGNYLRAIEQLNKVRAMDDSLFDSNKNNEIARLQIEYETEQKDKNIQLKEQNIKLLGKEAELQKSKTREAKKIQNISFGVILLVIIFLAILYRGYYSKQKTNTLLNRQQAEIMDKNNLLSHLLEEKEWLLKEIHHRVKNNLQIVISLLNSQSAFLTNTAAITAIKDSQRRVHSMSLIHQKLYQSENMSAIGIKNYIYELVQYLKDSFDTGGVEFRQQVDDVKFDVSQVVPIGLILNEAITNSMKYAFAGDKRGVISISLKGVANDTYELLITDNGVGINIDLENTESLGMTLIQGLSQDLNGSFEIYNDNGTVIKIVFKDSYQPLGKSQ